MPTHAFGSASYGGIGVNIVGNVSDAGVSEPFAYDDVEGVLVGTNPSDVAYNFSTNISEFTLQIDGVDNDAATSREERFEIYVNGAPYTVPATTLAASNWSYTGTGYLQNLGTNTNQLVLTVNTTDFPGGISSLEIRRPTDEGDLHFAVYDLSIQTDAFVPCFCSGTRIQTSCGEIMIEDLVVGDHVWTKHNEYQPIRWIGNSKVSSEILKLYPKRYPIRIKAGAFGGGYPKQDLLVSRQHRLLISLDNLLCQNPAPKALISAIKLIDLPNISIATDVDDVEYFHLLFDNHQVILAEGLEAESLLLSESFLRQAPKSVIKDIYEAIEAHPTIVMNQIPASWIPDGKHQKALMMSKSAYDLAI